ncbi:TerC family protein [Dendrosporobacter sp. 1207_IL3150]|uniref:TerC family protein n=1 Tax=Dendrosporobacter sp. 1207_IL3150 TaxID=3084054 RepID=UPI002FDA9757
MFEFIFSPDWFMALGSILLLDLILSGDNAIIIALACKDLPPEQRRKAIFWGSFGAVALRVSLTLVAARLLEIPYLQFIAGVALLWIAIKLLANESDDVNCKEATTLTAAVKTILFADLIMSLDNVLSLAAVAQAVPNGKYSLILIGLLASIPLVVWGSQLFIKLINKFPLIIYAGAAVLGFASAEMILADKVIGPMFHYYSFFIQATLTIGVVVIGHMMKIRCKNASTEVTPSEN